MAYSGHQDKEQVTILLSKDLHAKISEFAKLNGCSFSLAARLLLAAGIKTSDIKLKSVEGDDNV